MKLDELINILADFRARHGGDLTVVVEVAELLIDVQAASIIILDMPAGEKVIAVNANVPRI